MTNVKLTQDELRAIKERAKKAHPAAYSILAYKSVAEDIPKLLAEVERLRKELKFVINADMTPETKDASQVVSEIKAWANYVIGGDED